MLDNDPFSGMSFASVFSQSVVCLDSVLHRAEAFNFNAVQLFSPFCHGSCVWCRVSKATATPRAFRFSRTLLSRSIFVVHFKLRLVTHLS